MTSTIPTLLRIDASARTTGSRTRRLGDAAEAIGLQRHPHGNLQTAERELSHLFGA